MSGNDRFIPIGRIGASWGVKGWVKVQSFTQPLDNILTYEPWYLKQAHGWQIIKRTDARQQGKSIVAHFEGFNDCDETQVIRGAELAIPHDQLPSLSQHEYYWADLEGLEVIDQHDQKLGHISHLIETGANDVIVIANGKNRLLIPYRLGVTVTKIDLASQQMRVDWELD